MKIDVLILTNAQWHLLKCKIFVKCKIFAMKYKQDEGYTGNLSAVLKLYWKSKIIPKYKVYFKKLTDSRTSGNMTRYNITFRAVKEQKR